MYILGSDQALAKVAEAVAGGIHDENQDPVHVGIEIAENSLWKLERRSQIVGYEEAAVSQILARPESVRKNETVYSEGGNNLERGLTEFSVLKVPKE